MEVVFGIEYSCYSPLSENDESKYISEINGSILVFDENDRFLEIAGKFSFSLINLSLASADGYNAVYIFDTEDHLMAIGECLYDFETDVFIQQEEDFDDAIVGDNLLAFDYIEIAAKYRGKKLAAMVIKDVINRFGQYCAFVAARIFTLQHVQQDNLNEEEQEWIEKLRLEELEQDEEQAFYKLAAYFQSLGFINVNDDDIFVLKLAKINPIDDIKLQSS